MFLKVATALVVCLLIAASTLATSSGPVYGYECQNNRCVRVELDTSNEKPVSLSICRILCGSDPGTIWPKVTGNLTMDNVVARINPAKIHIELTNHKTEHKTFFEENQKRLRSQINAKIPPNYEMVDVGKKVKIVITVELKETRLTMDTDECYLIKTVGKGMEVSVQITALTIYGARHALETLSQLIAFDDIRGELQMVNDFEITDGPAYKHRGLLLDTARNYYSIESIKRTIDGMAMVKLNTFHWHITDSQSFPLVLKSQPELSKYGAYSARKVYTARDIAEVLDYAHVRGVRVLPEFDAPAHVGEGWQRKGLTSCFNAQPWKNYCVEPPCGQLDPTKEAVYDVLEDIYREMFEMFRNPDVFHMGGDEVSHACWNSSEDIRRFMTTQGWGLEELDFMNLWKHFQDNALARVDKVSTIKSLPVIMWTSRLTDVPYVDMALNTDRYIIQVWTTGTDSKIQDLLQRGYKMIMSNYDALYFDCGFGSWVGEGTNWCSPYIGWEKVYKNDLGLIAGDRKSQMLGAEAALWSEQADSSVLDGRFWPRASALAERLWSDPTTSWRDAEPRMLVHRERLVENGLAAESLQPQWCLQHEGDCPVGF